MQVDSLELLDYLEGMCVNQALCISCLRLVGLCNCQSLVLLRGATAMQCPQADSFWRSIYKWEIRRVKSFVARGRNVGLGSVQCLL